MIAISCSSIEKLLIKHLVLLDKRNTEPHLSIDVPVWSVPAQQMRILVLSS